MITSAPVDTPVHQLMNVGPNGKQRSQGNSSESSLLETGNSGRNGWRTKLRSRKLKDKVDDAAKWKLITPEMQASASEVSQIAGRVLHNKPGTDDEAFQALALARDLLLKLFPVP